MSLSSVDFQSQIASIMEVLANAAVAEICKVVDDGYAVVQLEMSQSHKESDFLRRKIKLLELQVARYRAERMKCSDASPHSRYQGVRLFNRHGRDTLTGASMQSRARLVKSSMNNRQRDSQTQSIDIDQDPQQEVVTTTRCESADPVEVEPELLIVKVEGALEIDDQEGPADARREPTLPPVGFRAVSDVAGCSQMEGQIYQNSSLLVKEESREDSQDGTLTRFQSTALEHSAAEDKEQPFCSTSMTEAVPGCSSSSPYKTSFPLNSERFRGTSILDQNSNLAVKSDVILIDSPSDDRGDAVTPLALWKRRDGGPAHWSRGMDPVSMAYQHHVLPCQAQNSPEQLMYSSDVNRDLTAPSASVTVATEERQQHQHQLLPLWVGFQDASQHPHQNPSTSVSQNQGVQSHSQPPPSRPPYSCPICGRQYLHLCQLRTHQRVHTGEKPFQCTQCGKQFGQFCSLKRHQRVHTGEKPYRCTQCGKQFSTSNNLKVHQSVHTGEKRFHCSQCGKNFSFLSNLIRHQAVHAAGKQTLKLN